MNTHNIGRQISPISAAARALNPPPGHTFQPPILFRLPKPGSHDPFFGGGRSFWNERILPTQANSFNPPIKSIVDRKKGAVRGVRFIVFESALAFFARLAAQQNPPQTTEHATNAAVRAEAVANAPAEGTL